MEHLWYSELELFFLSLQRHSGKQGRSCLLDSGAEVR